MTWKKNMNKTLKHNSRHAHFHLSHDVFLSVRTEAAIIPHNVVTLRLVSVALIEKAVMAETTHMRLKKN